MRKLFFLLLISGVLVFAGCGNSGQEQPAKVKQFDPVKFVIAGSGTNLPITVKLAEGYEKQSGVPCEVPPSIGSDGAIIAVKTGELELGLISRSLTQQETDSGLKAIPYARVGIIFGVSLDVPDDNLTVADLLKIHEGVKTKWSNGQTINVIIREAHDSSNQVLYSLIPGWEQMIAASLKEKRWQVAYKDVEVPSKIRSMACSIGLTDSTEVMKKDSQIKALRINNVAPNDATITNNSYPFSKMLYFLYKGTMTERSSQFIDYVKSEPGDHVIRANGGIPSNQVN